MQMCRSRHSRNARNSISLRADCFIQIPLRNLLIPMLNGPLGDLIKRKPRWDLYIALEHINRVSLPSSLAGMWPVLGMKWVTCLLFPSLPTAPLFEQNGHVGLFALD